MFRKQSHGVAIDVKPYQLPQLPPIIPITHEDPKPITSGLARRIVGKHPLVAVCVGLPVCDLDGSGRARVGVRSGSLPVKAWQLFLRH